jgi:hypothetical protein
VRVLTLLFPLAATLIAAGALWRLVAPALRRLAARAQTRGRR